MSAVLDRPAINHIHVERIIDTLLTKLSPQEIGSWMKTPHPALAGTPVDALLQGRVGEVIQLANRFIDALQAL